MVKIERSFPAPSSLAGEAKKASGSYNEPDVVQQLSNDFHNKCYICELKGLQDPQVEHLLPHIKGKYPERKFDWENLFWSCGHCNGIKNQKKYEDGIIDCCKEDPEELLSVYIKDNKVQGNVKVQNNTKAELTLQLVTEVFNYTNTGMRIYKSEMRYQELLKEMNKLYDALEELDSEECSSFTMRKLRILLKRESAFASFKREYIRQHKEKYPQLLMLIA